MGRSQKVKSMNGPSMKFRQTMLWVMTSAISSPELADGHTPCVSLDGPTIDRCGQEAARASLSRRRASRKAKPTSGTSGPISFGSSASVALTQSLASRLKRRLGTGGSMEYAQTWKEKVTPSGRSYWAHTASARRTSGSDCFGWPTPNTMDHLDRMGLRPSRLATGRTGGYLTEVVTMLAGWRTPSASEDATGTANGKMQQMLSHQALLTGSATNATTAATAKVAAFRLNPLFALWLMGYPVAWACCGARAMQSCRKSRRSSFVRTQKLSIKHRRQA